MEKSMPGRRKGPIVRLSIGVMPRFRYKKRIQINGMDALLSFASFLLQI
ncbi:hypothetical protein [Paraburkholderia sp. J67]|nr:hypothetical protein [Paraburkholderia sp. J67]